MITAILNDQLSDPSYGTSRLPVYGSTLQAATYSFTGRKMTILITGATGQVGGEAARTLAAKGKQVRALVRDPARATGLDGIELVQGDFGDDASMARALDGIESVLLTGRDSPDTVALQSNVLKNIWESKVRHVVKLSAIGAKRESPIELMRDHFAVDEKLRAGPTDWTLLQPHLYMQNLTRAAATARKEGKLSAPMADIHIPLVDTRDIGAAAAAVLLDPSAHAGQTYQLTGPETYSYDDVAQALSNILGRPVTYKSISSDDFESGLKAAGIPDWRAFDLAHITSAYGPEDYGLSADFEKLVGRSPTSMASFMEDYRDTFLGH
ncbi:MAG: SDR family oxidoreductase [Sinobacteraceae bacterium]|nr:SDR family oxidoreductase [Nevskiaceae bacterium]